MKSQISILLVLLFSPNFFAQNSFSSYKPTALELQNQRIKSKEAVYYQVDLEEIRTKLISAPYRENANINHSTVYIDVPLPTGKTVSFKVLRNQTMHPEYNQLFPEIIAFDGVGKNNSIYKAKFDITPQGFHAMIFGPDNSTIFMDPIAQNTPNKLMVYSKKDFVTDKLMSCSTDTETSEFLKEIDPEHFNKILYGSCQLRTYRLALAATTEYTTFHGGTVALAAAAQVTTMNRVNGVYERDMAITMVIVPNNNLLIYAGTDPYTNGTPGTMISENQNNVTSVIGSANYDIGHVFGTNSGGLAGLGVVCSNSNKARGVTGSSAPVGDPFDIDYVAHEMGHQFKANHTQNNNCNRNNATAVEPGSASSIMGYAGICSPNVQNNSDDHFHGASLKEISNFITGASHTCPVVTGLSNSAPVISSTNGNVSIPANTPFALKAVATDADGDALTYNWEQMNNEVSTQPPLPTNTNGPNFRSKPSSTNPIRYFPSLASQVSGGPFTWEVIPSVSRTMNFRCSVRDNAVGGGCADYADVTVTTVATAGPFVVLYPSSTGISWTGLTSQTVTWNVANTTASPISATNVSIYLSTDGGLTYPTLLISNTANDGSEAIVVPNTPSTTARIMVISGAGTFFDISDNNFTITMGAPCNSPSIPVISGSNTVCQGMHSSLSLSGTLNDATTWQWYSGSCGGTPVGTGTSINITPMVATSYFVRGIGGCVIPGTCASFSVGVTQLNLYINQNGNTLFSLQPPTNTSYQWIDCVNGNSIISGANNQSYDFPVVTGSYAVIVSKDGCTDTSDCKVVDLTGLENLDEEGWMLSPNPSSEKVVLAWKEGLEVKSIQLFDSRGRLILEHEISDGNQATISVSDLESAVYYVQIRHQNGAKTMKLQKN